MNLKLIGPAIGGASVGGFGPMLSLGILAALTPGDVRVTIADEHVEPIDFEEQVDLVGISTLTPTAPRAYAIADRFRRKGVPVVLGGVHPTFMPDEAGLHADAVCIGEAEGYWGQVVDDFKAGALKRVYQPPQRPNPVIVPVARRELFSKSGYIIRKTLLATRGCPFNCSFCSIIRQYGGGFRQRPIEDVVAEVQSLRRRGPVAFVDDNIVGDPKWAKRLFRALVPTRIRWVGQGSITLAEDDSLLELAARSGCIGMYIGLESVQQGSLDEVNKYANQVERFEGAIKKIQSRGIIIHGGFIFGMDTDDESAFERTVRFAQRVKLESASFGILTPFPGTPLYERLDREGRILDRDWEHYDIAHVVFEPKLMSARALREGQVWAMKEFYSVSSMFQRLNFFRIEFPFIALLNLAHRRVARDLDRSLQEDSSGRESSRVGHAGWGGRFDWDGAHRVGP